MMKKVWLACAMILLGGTAMAQPGRYSISGGKYEVTEDERAACQNDAVQFCSEAFQNEDALLTCMKTARPKLTESCRVVFEAGLRRRHIPF